MANAKCVLVTKGTYGDLVPFLALGCALKARGNKVTLVTHCEYEEVSHRLGLEFDSWDSPSEYRDFIEDGPLLETPLGLMGFFDGHIFPQLSVEELAILRHLDRRHSVLVVRHMASLASQLIAERERIPFVSVFTAVAQVSSLPILEIACRDLLFSRLNAARAAFGLEPKIEGAGVVPEPDLHLACWPKWFANSAETWPSNMVNVGFLRSDEAERGDLSEELRAWVLEGSPVLITGGTSISKLSPRFYRVAADACSLAGRKAIIACRHRELVPDGLPDRIRWFPFLPFATIMDSVAAVIHHGGTSVLVRALSSAVPQLMLPFGADRPDTAARVAHLGVGVRLLPPQWNAETVAGALAELISPTVRAACTDLQGCLSDHSALETGCKAIENLASTSPAGELRA